MDLHPVFQRALLEKYLSFLWTCTVRILPNQEDMFRMHAHINAMGDYHKCNT